jgi:ABC-type nickel/cobalt efflux system permease component RcnA
MTMSEQLRRAGAVCLMLFGLVILAGVFIGLVEGTSSYAVQTDVMLSLVFGVLPLGGGVWLYWRLRQAVAQRIIAERERVVLQLAVQHRGVLTAVEVATDSTLTLEQAQETLAQLNLKGVNQMDVSDLGVVVYRFPFDPTS